MKIKDNTLWFMCGGGFGVLIVPILNNFTKLTPRENIITGIIIMVIFSIGLIINEPDEEKRTKGHKNEI